MFKWFYRLFKHKEIWVDNNRGYAVNFANTKIVKVKRDSKGRFK